MTYVQQMYYYLVGNSDKYNYRAIEYTRGLVERIENEKGVIYEFLMENDICFDKFLEETLTLSEWRFDKYGNSELTGEEFEEICDSLVIEADIQKLEKSYHIESYIMENNEKESRIYIPDQFAVDYFKEKYDIDMEVNKPFDLDYFYETPTDPNNPNIELFGDICLN
jgi:hypothetical protein